VPIYEGVNECFLNGLERSRLRRFARTSAALPAAKSVVFAACAGA
jgi:hypothetical protein